MREKAETELADAKQVNAEKDTRIAELEAQVDELTPFRAEAEKLRQEKADAELAAKRQELSAFAESQGLDTQSEAVAAAIQEVNYAFLMAEAMKQNKKPQPKPTLASFAVAGGMPLGGEYDDLLGKG